MDRFKTARAKLIYGLKELQQQSTLESEIGISSLVQLLTDLMGCLTQILPREGKTRPPTPFGDQDNSTQKRKSIEPILGVLDEVVKACEKASLQDLVKLEMNHDTEIDQRGSAK